MPIRYKVASRIALGSNKETRYYARATKREMAGFRDISRIISDRCTASAADVMLVLTALSDLIPELIADGRSVKLDGIGIFSSSFKAQEKDKPEEVTAKTIEQVRLKFLPDKEIKQQLKHCEFEKVK